MQTPKKDLRFILHITNFLCSIEDVMVYDVFCGESSVSNAYSGNLSSFNQEYQALPVLPSVIALHTWNVYDKEVKDASAQSRRT